MRCIAIVCLAACHSASHVASDAGADAPAEAAPTATITATVNSTRFVTREHMLAAGEMQISGEPLAEAMGRDLAGYSRFLIPTDVYTGSEVWVDLPGFSTAVESYEYSKQPMNNLAFESGAGTSLTAVTPNLAVMIQHFAQGSNAYGKWVFAGGWPGMLPTVHVFASFDPTIDPTSAVDLQCSISSDDNPSESGDIVISADYECDASTLHLRDRASQIEPTITPGADGFSGWKYGLWVLNYLQIMHDGNNAAVMSVPESELAGVGSNGTYLGSSDIEGFQAQMFLLEMQQRADDWLLQLTTTDGATLSGFSSVSAALAYDYATPLRWFPGKIAVTETNDVPSYSLAAAQPEALDLIGLAMGYAEIYALTDTGNADVGGSQPARAFFDGDPFSADTFRDHALAMMRVALVDLDRMQTPAPVSTTTVAYTVIGLRTVLRSLSSQLELYSNNTPDTAIGATPLDALPIHYPGDDTLTFTGRLVQIERAQAELLYNQLTDATGRAYTGVDDTDVLDAHTAAIRGLFAAYLATGDTRYRDRAKAVFARVEAVFYDPGARIYSATPAPVDSVEYTPLRFALLQSALRDMYELVAARPGGEALEPVLEERIGRLNKLVLNGWDDRDRNRLVAWPDECTNVIDGLPRGGLQMAERTLTGETGRYKDEGGGGSAMGGPPTSDREHDCVPEIDDAHLPSALADSVTFRIAR